MSVGVTTRYLGIAKGALVMTGNTFGLDKEIYNSSAANDPFDPGNLGSQGVFLTVNTPNMYPSNWQSIYTQNQTPSPVGILRYNQVSETNRIGSSAKLYIPMTINKILHAELVWFANLYTGVNSNQSIFFTHPTQTGESRTETIDSTQFKATYDLTSSAIPFDWRMFVRSADVTPYIQKGENTYTVEGISATLLGGKVDANCSGWCMMVAYEDLSMDYNNMSMYVMAAPVAARTEFAQTQVLIPNIVTPLTGELKGKAVIAAAEGDVRYTGDYVTFGPNENPTTRLAVGSHTTNNFFVGEISIADTDDDIGGPGTMGAIDTRGSMGNNNHDESNSVLGARHGLDIARVDTSNTLKNGQTSAYMKFATSGDVYSVIAFGSQIMVEPSLTKDVDLAIADVGDIITYSSTIVNGGSVIAWTNVYFQDSLPPGTEFVPGTVEVYYNDVLQSGFEDADPVVGFALTPSLPRTLTVIVKFKIIVVDFSIIPDSIIDNESHISYTLTDSSGNSFRVKETSNKVQTLIQHGDLIIRKQNQPTGIVTCSHEIHYTVQVENVGSVNVIVAVGGFQDPCPNHVSYIGTVTSSSNTTGYDNTSFAFNAENTAVVNVKELVITPNEIITINFTVKTNC